MGLPLGCAGRIIQPAMPAGFEEIECADNIRLNEIAWAADRAIDVRLRREMQYVRDRMLLNDAQNRRLVAQIHLFKDVFRMSVNRFQIGRVAGIRETIEVDQPRDFRAVDNVLD